MPAFNYNNIVLYSSNNHQIRLSRSTVLVARFSLVPVGYLFSASEHVIKFAEILSIRFLFVFGLIPIPYHRSLVRIRQRF